MTVVLRELPARPRPSRLLVVNGPGVVIDPGALELLGQRWASSFGLELDIRPAKDESAAARLLQEAAADAIVVNPGSAVLLDALPASALTAYVEFASPGLPELRFERGPLEDIAGRGLDGYRWAISYLLACAEWPLAICRYGEERDQVGELRLPEGPGPHPLAVLIHGGGWKALWRKDLMAPMAVALARAGVATWSIEYRRLGAGGDWPALFDDVAAAIDGAEPLAGRFELDLERLLLVGHSAGGQLALWASQPGRLRVVPAAVVSLAGLLDLVESARRQMIGGDGVVARLLGGSPEQVPERYAAASPRALLPLGVPQYLVQGLDDHLVDLIDQNRAYAAAAVAAGERVELSEIGGATHLDLIDPGSAAWPRVAAAIEAGLAGRR